MSSLSPLQLAAAVSGAVMTVVWLVTLWRFSRVTGGLPVLRAGTAPTPSPAARISVIVAAKDEAGNIEACVRSILAQDWPALELVVVNDRSTDDTLPILERLAGEYGERLRVLTIRQLPEGWGGQNHAISQGVQVARGEWLLFTDADCKLDAPDTVRTAYAEAATRGADMLSIVPRMEAPTFWEQVYLPLCCLVFMMRLRIGEVNRPGSAAAYANGAFMLVRRSMYEALGGHARVRDQLNDDIALAHLAKTEGYCLRVAGNADLVRTRMYGSARQAWNGWARNFYGTLRTPRSLGLALGGTLALFVLPWLLLLTCLGLARWEDAGWNWAALCWGAAVLISHVGAWAVAWGLALRPVASLLYLPGALFVSAIVARAWSRAWRNTSMVWQGARYAPGSAPRAKAPSPTGRGPG